jgi:hypothetical protein
MSDLRDLDSGVNEAKGDIGRWQGINSQARQVSIAEVVSEDTSKNIFIIYFKDDKVEVPAVLLGNLNGIIGSATPEVGELVLVVHNETSDAIIIGLLDKQRSIPWADNSKSSAYNKNGIIGAMGN